MSILHPLTGEFIDRLPTGKLPYKDHPKTFKLSRYIDLSAMPPPPPSYDLTSNPNFPRDLHMFNNDKYGCCTIAAIAHMVMMEAMLMGKTVSITDLQVLNAYYAIGRSENPGQKKPDNGCIMLDVLNYFRKHMLGRREIEAFIQIDNVHNHDHVKRALMLFDGIDLGFGISNPDQLFREFDQHIPWTPESGTVTEGHAVTGIGWDPATINNITWGRLQRGTWAWWDAQVDEAWVILFKGFSIPNFDHKTLAADLAAINS